MALIALLFWFYFPVLSLAYFIIFPVIYLLFISYIIVDLIHYEFVFDHLRKNDVCLVIVICNYRAALFDWPVDV